MRPLLLVLLLALPAWAGIEKTNNSGELNKTYTQVVVKEASGDKPEIAQDARAKVFGKKVWVYLPEAEEPLATRAVLFYDWGYQLEITVYEPEEGKRYILVCPDKKEQKF